MISGASIRGNWDSITKDGAIETRSHNDVNELTHREDGLTADLRYDDNGNLVENDEYEYAYDAFNRLVEVTDKETGDTIATYRYDTQNRRVSKEVTNSSGLNGTTEYVYEGWQVVEERDGSGGVEKTYTYGSYIDEPITMTNVGNTGSPTYYYHTNNLYNVRALTDASGDVVERYRYSAYGEPTILDDAGNERQRSAVGNPYMFQGRRMDTETGLYYYRNRYYSAQLGRFVTRDPMGYVDGYNLYAYVGNNPTMSSDPMGQKKNEHIAVLHDYTGEPCRIKRDDIDRLGRYVEWEQIENTVENAMEKTSWWEKVRGLLGMKITQKRYVYTRVGWVDLRHAASAGSVPLASYGTGFEAGVIKEISQYVSGLRGNELEYQSAFKKEDIRSNLIGSMGAYTGSVADTSLARGLQSVILRLKPLSHKEAWDQLCLPCEESE